MTCPHPKQLQQMLDDTLPLDEQPPIKAHLETCPLCQKKLEQLAAGGVTWDKTARNLSDKPTPNETALIDAVEKLQDTPTSAILTQAETPAGPIDEDLSFLQPSQKPNSLGKLDHYEILSVVGKGGFGLVLKAFDETLHRIVAIKVLLPHLAANGTARERFLREARSAAAVTHENVVTIHAVEGKAKIPYLVMQFVSGITLADKIDKAGPLGLKETLRIGMQIAEGLAAANKHEGLVHRDIKPANILLENGVERVKITDFGLARAADDASLTQSGTVAGTPMYMSPEQANGEPLDHRSDLFSLGSVLYVMCTGRAPFRANSTLAVMKRVVDDTPTPVRQINAEIPDWLTDIIAKLHAKKPGDRYQTAREVAEVLGRHLTDLQAGRAGTVGDQSATPTMTMPAIQALASPAAALAGPPRRRRRVLAALFVAAVILLAFGIAAMEFAWTPFLGRNSEKDTVNAFVVPVFGGPGWRQLWNGSDASRWIGMGDANWGRGDFLLFPGASKETKDKMPRNFHLRMEVNLIRGQGAICFHGLPAAANLQPPKDGCFVTFVENPANPDGKLSSMVDARMLALAPGKLVGQETPVAAAVAKPGEWFYLEIIVTEQNADVLINGKKVLALQDAEFPLTEGVITLWNNSRKDPTRQVHQSSIAFRNIEIKDLTREEPGAGLLKDAVLIMNFEKDTFYEKDGKTYVRDLSGHGNDGLCEKVAFTPDGKAGGGLLCQGGHLQLPKSLINLQPNYTITAWCRCEKAGSDGSSLYSTAVAGDLDNLNSSMGVAPGRSYHVNAWNPGRPEHWLAAATDAPAVPAGWFFVAVSLTDGAIGKGKLRIVINDQVHTRTSQMVANDGEPRPADMIGCRSDGVVIDEVAVFQRALSDREIAAIRRHGMAGKPLLRTAANSLAWVQLFNGKDLTGWMTANGKTGNWKVENAAITCTGPQAYLYTDRSDFGDFHLRAEVKINDTGNSGIYFRAAKPVVFVGDYEAQICTRADQPKTGSLYGLQNIVEEVLVPPGTWFTLQVIAQGNRMQILVNGKQTVNYVEEKKGSPLKGYIALQHLDPETAVHFRKIEIKELPPTPPAPALPRAEKGVLDYAEIHDADEKRFDDWIAKMKKDEFRPVSLSVQTVKDAPRYSAVAIKEEKKKLWEFSRDLNDDDGHYDALVEKNYGVISEGLYRNKGKLYDAYLWLWNPAAGIDALWNSDTEAILKKNASAAKRKKQPVGRCAIMVDGVITHAVVHGDGDRAPWVESVNQPIDECKAWIEKHQALDWRPLHLYAYGDGPKTLFGSVLVQDPNAPDWDVSWALTPAQYEAELTARRKQEFRPHYAIGHHDDDGAQRFSVIWIRYRADAVAIGTTITPK